MFIRSKNIVFEMDVSDYEDIVVSRKKAREIVGQMGYTQLDQTRVVTAVSELSRNMVVHADTGHFTIMKISKNLIEGLLFVFHDQGPGIENVETALKKGFSTSGSLGLGLYGAKSLADEFDIDSTPKRGTRISFIIWKK